MQTNEELQAWAPNLYEALEEHFPKDPGWRWHWLWAKDLKIKCIYTSEKEGRFGIAMELVTSQLDSSKELFSTYVQKCILALRRSIEFRAESAELRSSN